MSVPPPGQLPIVLEVRCAAIGKWLGTYQYRIMRPVARMAPAIDRMCVACYPKSSWLSWSSRSPSLWQLTSTRTKSEARSGMPMDRRP